MHFFSYKTLCCKTWCQDKCNIHFHFQNLERALHVGSFPFGVDSYRDEEIFEGYGPGDGNGGDDGGGDEDPCEGCDGGNGDLNGQRVGNNTNVGAD